MKTPVFLLLWLHVELSHAHNQLRHLHEDVEQPCFTPDPTDEQMG